MSSDPGGIASAGRSPTTATGLGLVEKMAVHESPLPRPSNLGCTLMSSDVRQVMRPSQAPTRSTRKPPGVPLTSVQLGVPESI